MATRVSLGRVARKALRRSPKHVVVKLLAWVELVETEGLAHARAIPGYRDEALRGKRFGQRSIRLSRAWRAIYTVEKSTGDERAFGVVVAEVNKHDY